MKGEIWNAVEEYDDTLLNWTMSASSFFGQFRVLTLILQTNTFVTQIHKTSN